MKSKYMKTTQQILDQMFSERNASPKTQETYTRSISYFESLTGKSLPFMLDISESEEEDNISWKNSSLRQWLIDYRKWCYSKYKISTAETYFIAIITTFRHFEITVQRLPYFSTKQGIKSKPINPDKMVDRDILRLCIETNNPLLKALVLLMSSSGISRIDVLNLTIEDYLAATNEYHNCSNIDDAIEMMGNVDVIPTWNLTRQKTGQFYYTFSSPESTRAINNYLLTRNDKDKRLFKLSKRYISQLFKMTNDNLGLGKNGTYSRFTPHMLRRYHATQLAEAGVNTDFINMLQGRKASGIAYESYVKIKPSKLKDEYIGALPFLVVEDINRVKTELDVTKDELDKVNSENIALKSRLDDVFDRLEKLENERKPTWNEFKRLHGR